MPFFMRGALFFKEGIFHMKEYESYQSVNYCRLFTSFTHLHQWNGVWFSDAA